MSSLVTVEQYTEKSIVVRGNTIPYKNKLLSLGGKWNKMLRGGEGWIFPLTKKSTVEQALSEPPSMTQSENSTHGNETGYEKSQSSTSEPKKRTPTFVSSPNSSEIVLSKKEYLHLISRVEKTEQLILRVDRLEKLLNVNDKPLDTEINQQTNLKKSKLPLLSNINENDLADYEPENDSEEEDEERNRKVQPLLRKKKTIN